MECKGWFDSGINDHWEECHVFLGNLGQHLFGEKTDLLMVWFSLLGFVCTFVGMLPEEKTVVLMVSVSFADISLCSSEMRKLYSSFWIELLRLCRQGFLTFLFFFPLGSWIWSHCFWASCSGILKKKICPYYLNWMVFHS